MVTRRREHDILGYQSNWQGRCNYLRAVCTVWREKEREPLTVLQI